jgi:hypothetical protein
MRILVKHMSCHPESGGLTLYWSLLPVLLAWCTLYSEVESLGTCTQVLTISR